MKNFKYSKGIDEDAIIKILCFRSNQQRQEIAKVFKTNYLKDLHNELKTAIQGNLQNLLMACMTPGVEYYCTEINRALHAQPTNDNMLIEALCTLNNYEISMLKENYLKSERIVFKHFI